eukprot:3080480-Rhodomonas_salina.1
MEWYYELLHPFEHFVPVKPDLSDLCDRVQWLQTHPDDAQRIAENGQKFVQDVFTEKMLYMYITD